MLPRLAPPEPLTAGHDLSGFDCGESVLNDWLRRRALLNQASGASRTFVVADDRRRVHGYYALAAGAVAHTVATSRIRRNMPDPVPVMVLGRLAVDHQAQGSGLGAALLQDALKRTLAVSRNAGVRALLVHAMHDRAREFYLRHGFMPSPVHPLTLMLSLGSLSVK